MNKWKKRIRTDVLVWRERDSMYGFTNLVEAGHVTSLQIDFINDGKLRNRSYYQSVNMHTLEAGVAS